MTQASLPVIGGETFPVRRIFCIGKNYADHAAEMGSDPKSEPPVFFTKPADAVFTGETMPFPPITENLHFEGELVVALRDGGKNLGEEEARACVYGYACGCDLTRRDLQSEAKKRGAPWDMAKGFDNSAAIGPLVPMPGEPMEGELATLVNGEERQRTSLSKMIWSVPETLSRLSRYVELKPGDLLFTGTPAGVGRLDPGDRVEVTVADLPSLRFTLAG
ncbi:fumarylacetoacetate hydrolase family protein [Parvularcula maris]|uniref:Fumarylacetoacetate hydrolase family protein n=1 Tax=Parvularcula maris TaxID=2965077 RepID=A0A9X2LDM3_9PROT|nr:fumarylacetoacetate hydrolase family protein [Parvularcula maris]